MTRSILILVASLGLIVPGSVQPSAQQTANDASAFVSTWTLNTLERGQSPEARVSNPRGLLVLDGAGYAFEFVTSQATQRMTGGQIPIAEAQAVFAAYGGFWGNYRVDAAQRRITFRPESGISPMLSNGQEFSRTFELSGDRLTITSINEPHTPTGTKWVWERVPTIDNLSPLYRRVVGFWRHIVERRINLTTGAVLSETKRSPSLIVYTPGGFVGVHFPPLNRKPFAGDTPTPEEARAALTGYIGYYGALTVYPGLVFHNILGGTNPVSGTTLRRFVELNGDEATVRLPTTRNQQGQEMSTVVILKRLSGETEMMPR